MATRQGYFDDYSRRGASGRASDPVRPRPRSFLFDEWGREDKPSIPMLRSRWGTVTAAVVGIGIGLGLVALWAGGVLDRASLQPTATIATEPKGQPESLLLRTNAELARHLAIAPVAETPPATATPPASGAALETPATDASGTSSGASSSDPASPSEPLDTAPRTRGESVPPAIRNEPTEEQPLPGPDDEPRAPMVPPQDSNVDPSVPQNPY